MKKDLSKIPANYYEPDYTGPGLSLMLMLVLPVLILLGLSIFGFINIVS